MKKDIIQGTPEWFEARRGKVTGSRIADVLMKSNLAGYRNYLAQLACERITGTVEESYESYDMARGKELEPLARSLYEFLNDVKVVEVGFVDHPYIPMMGCSPDGLIIDKEATESDDVGHIEGMIEIKCPKSAQHQDLLLGGAIDGKYIKQMQEQKSCTGAPWTDYCSYDPTMPDELKLKVIRVFRDDKVIAEMETASILFLKEVSQRVADLEALCKR